MCISCLDHVVQHDTCVYIIMYWSCIRNMYIGYNCLHFSHFEHSYLLHCMHLCGVQVTYNFHAGYVHIDISVLPRLFVKGTFLALWRTGPSWDYTYKHGTVSHTLRSLKALPVKYAVREGNNIICMHYAVSRSYPYTQLRTYCTALCTRCMLCPTIH